ncbi:MAG: YhcN/YlaJ family sporulation lipoprotein [Clostridia bacterium]|nr:YhcN/YlaJ family sporulation lipoprotein [Clostridia bacterium]
MKFDRQKLESLKRMFFVLALILVVGVGVTGCMNRNVDEDVTGGVNDGRITQASPAPNYMPQGTAMNSAAANNEAARFDWSKNASQIEAQIAQISEISEARLVVTGNTALVAVRFNQAYQGEMTERIREMIAAEVMAADPEITTVAVTADDEDVNSVYDLANRVLNGTAMDDLKTEINEIVRNATTLR